MKEPEYYPVYAAQSNNYHTDTRHAGEWTAPEGGMGMSGNARVVYRGARCFSGFWFSVSVSQLFHGPIPRFTPAPAQVHRLAIRLRRSRSNTSTEYSLSGATQMGRMSNLNCRKCEVSGQDLSQRTG